MNNLSGQNLGRYHIVEPLGQGGMASVYKAYDTSLERYVAIKVIRTEVSGVDEAGFLARFRREARALAQLDHPYILKVLDYGEQDGLPYLVMPFEPGGTLKEKMGRPMPYQEAAALLAPVARALEYAHRLNIIHRDVKPANVLISHAGSPLLSDFGIAKILESGEATQLTATGVGIGTPDYMAPEQWLGNASPQTDIYSLGVVFYEMVTGRRPFTADTPAAVLLKHLQDPLPRPRTWITDLPESVELILFKALAKNAEDRFQTMGLFAAALEILALGDPTALPAVPIELATLQNPVALAPSVEATAARTLQVPPATRKDSEIWRIGLLAFAAVFGLLLICLVLGGGTYLASRWLNAPGGEAATVLPASQATQTGGARSTALSTNLPGVTGSQTPPPASPTPVETPSQRPPFQRIEGFPTDIPILKDNLGDLATTVSQGMTMYSFSSDLSSEQVGAFYKAGMEKNGWKRVSETMQTGQITWYFVKDETRMVMVSIMDQQGHSRIAIMLIKKGT
jgi:tRNA A-37 threonylcarbamoyl transferase component Bud32